MIYWSAGALRWYETRICMLSITSGDPYIRFSRDLNLAEWMNRASCLTSWFSTAQILKIVVIVFSFLDVPRGQRCLECDFFPLCVVIEIVDKCVTAPIADTETVGTGASGIWHDETTAAAAAAAVVVVTTDDAGNDGCHSATGSSPCDHDPHHQKSHFTDPSEQRRRQWLC